MDRKEVEKMLTGSKISPKTRILIFVIVFGTAVLVDQLIASRVTDNWFLGTLITMVLSFFVLSFVGGLWLRHKMLGVAQNITQDVKSKGRKVVKSKVKSRAKKK